MKALKGCANKECQGYKKRLHYKDDFLYCPYCGHPIEYVCADCWAILEQNHNRFCPDCISKHQQKRDQQLQQGKKVASKAVQVAPLVWKNKDKILDGSKKVIKIIAKK